MREAAPASGIIGEPTAIYVADFVLTMARRSPKRTRREPRINAAHQAAPAASTSALDAIISREAQMPRALRTVTTAIRAGINSAHTIHRHARMHHAEQQARKARLSTVARAAPRSCRIVRPW